MHELSIAKYLIKLVERHRPDEGQVQSIHIKAGPLQLVDTNALEWAWESASQGTDYAGTRLEIEQLPWTLHCPQCDCTWESDDLYETCACGSHNAYPQAGDDLLLDSIQMAGSCCESHICHSREGGNPGVDGADSHYDYSGSLPARG